MLPSGVVLNRFNWISDDGSAFVKRDLEMEILLLIYIDRRISRGKFGVCHLGRLVHRLG